MKNMKIWLSFGMDAGWHCFTTKYVNQFELYNLSTTPNRFQMLILAFPFHVFLYFNVRVAGTQSGFRCGGSLINENYVLTGLFTREILFLNNTEFHFFPFSAAHCMRGMYLLPQQYVLEYVRLGEHDERSNPDCQVEGTEVE